MMKVHYGTIDKEAGIPSTGMTGKRVSDGSWEGDTTDIYTGAWFQPKTLNGTTLNQFMTDHRKTGGVDLWKCTTKVGSAVLLAAINTEMPDLDPPDPAKDAWVKFLSKFS
jgi:hypothetical protein